jgi:hypothetical protein
MTTMNLNVNVNVSLSSETQTFLVSLLSQLLPTSSTPVAVVETCCKPKRARKSKDVTIGVTEFGDVSASIPTVFEQLQEGPAPAPVVAAPAPVVAAPASITIESLVEAITAQFENKTTTYEQFNAALKALGIKTIYDANQDQLNSLADSFGVALD